MGQGYIDVPLTPRQQRPSAQPSEVSVVMRGPASSPTSAYEDAPIQNAAGALPHWFIQDAPPATPTQNRPAADESHLTGFARELWAGINPVNFVESIVGAASDPRGTLKGIGEAQGRLGQEAMEAFKAGDYLTGTRKFVNYLTPLLGPAMDRSSELAEEGQYGASAGAATAIGAQAVAPELIRRVPSVTARVAPRNVNAAERAAVDFGMREGIPVDAATATGNRFVRGAQKLADESMLGSSVGERARQAQAQGLTATGERLADRAHPAAMTAEQAGQGARDAVTGRVREFHAEANTAYTRMRELETQRGGITVDVSAAKTALKPIYDALMREKDLAPLHGGKARALVALDRLMNGPNSASLSIADAALGDIKALARGADIPELRTQGQGVAARAVAELDAQVSAAAFGAGDEVAAALEAGRTATRAKYGAADVLDALRGEPVQVFNQLTAQRDSAVAMLRDVRKQAPEALPHLGRAYLDGLLQKATAEGGFGRAQGLMADWQRLGTQTKQMLFRDPGLVRDLDSFFLLAKRMADNPNPSGTAFTLTKTGEVTLLVNNLALGTAVSLSGAALSTLLHSPKAVRLMVRGLRMPVGNKAAAMAATAELTKLARESGVRLAPVTAETEP